jgi:PAS domain S-box-containing protein
MRTNVADTAAPRASSLLRVVRILGVAAAYAAAGRLCEFAATPMSPAMAAWPPAGIALAALLLFGDGVWPGVLLGAALTALAAPSVAAAAAFPRSIAVAAALGAAAAFQAYAGARLIRTFVGFPTALDDAADAAKFLLLGGPAACVIGALWSAGAVAAAGLARWTAYPFAAWTWWVGDAIGVMTVTPLVLIWAAEPRAVWRARRVSVGAPLLGALALALVIFPMAGASHQAAARVDFGQRPWQAWAVLGTAFAFIGLLASLLLVVTGRTLKSEALALENSRLYQRYRSLFEGVPVGLYRATPTGAILDVNPAFIRLLDYPNRDALGTLNAATLYLDPDLWAQWRARLERDAAVVDFEGQITRADGSLLWVQASIAAARDGEGRIAYYEGALVDITERKQAQASAHAMNDIVTAAAGAADLRGFLETLLDRTLAALEADHGGVWLEDGTSVDRRMPPGLTARVAGFELTQVQAVENWDAAGMPGDALRPIMRRAGVRASIAGPLLVDGRPIGGLVVTTARPRHWLAGERHLIEAIGRQIGAVAERLRLLDDVRAHAYDLEALHNLGAVLRRVTDLGAIYALITERTMALLHGDHAALLLLEPDGRTFQRVCVRAAKTVSLGATAAVSDRVAAAAVEQAGVFVVPDLAAAEAAAAGARSAAGRLGPCLAVPLREGERVIGALVLARRHRAPAGCFAPRDAALATALAELASHAIDRAQLTQQVAQELANVRGLYESAQRMAETLDLQAIAEDAVRRCVDAFGVRAAWIARIDDAARPQCLAYTAGSTALGPVIDDWVGATAPEAIRMSRTGRAAVIVPDVAAHPWAVPPAAAHGLALRAAGFFPLISRTSTFGVLAVYAPAADCLGEDRVNFFQAYAHQLAAALENARLYDDATRRLAQLQALHEIDQVIAGNVDLSASLSIVLAKAGAQLRADAACVLLFDPRLQVLEYAAGQGVAADASRRIRVRLGEGLPGQAALERRCVGTADLDTLPDGANPAVVAAPRGERFKAAYAVPLIAKGELLGVLQVLHRQAMTPDDEWYEFLDILARQTAIAISDARQLRALQRSHDDLTLAYDTTLEGWARALEIRDKETAGHTQRVTDLALRLAGQLGVGEPDFIAVRHGALLHDIGKMAISDAILLKPGRLDAGERAAMERHPVYARELIMPIPYLRPALDIPYHHHERWDGTGYPTGLKAEQIPLVARIFAVVDVWDALTHDRPYRRAWSSDRAKHYIRAESGRHFDPRVVEAFFYMLAGEEAAGGGHPSLRLVPSVSAPGVDGDTPYRAQLAVPF